MTASKFRQKVFAGKTAGGLGALSPQSITGAAVNGGIIDRLGAMSGKFIFEAAAASGAPDAAVASIIIQQDSAVGFASPTTFLTLETALDIDEAAVLKEYLFSLEGAEQFIRVVIDPTYTGGTTPANIVAGQIVLGDFDVEPQRAETVLGE